MEKMDDYDYGYTLGFMDGQVARRWIVGGKPFSHGDLLSAIDAYAIGYREGLK